MLNLKRTELEIKDKQATLWLNQPEIRNALNLSLIEEIIKVFKWINEQKDIMVIIIRGRGDSFCAGADINWMINSGLLEYQDCYRDSKRLAACFKTIYQSDKAVINLVHGDVYGGALGFLGAGDFTFAVKDTRFCLPELRLGLVPSIIMPYLLTKVKPVDIKFQIFSNGIFYAEDARNNGFIDNICENIDDMELRADELISKIFSSSPQALAESKRLLRDLNKSLINSDNIKKTIKTITRMKMSEDSRERMSRFKTKK